MNEVQDWFTTIRVTGFLTDIMKYAPSKRDEVFQWRESEPTNEERYDHAMEIMNK